MFSFFLIFFYRSFLLVGLDKAEKNPYTGWKTNVDVQNDSPENEYVAGQCCVERIIFAMMCMFVRVVLIRIHVVLDLSLHFSSLFSFMMKELT